MGLLVVAGCASKPADPAAPARRSGPGAFVAGVGGGLVNLHDGIARTILGKNAGPMLIAAPAPAEPVVVVHADDSAVVAGHREASETQSTTTAPTESAWPDEPAFTAEHIARSRTADLDDDGYVALDEIVALARSGLSDTDVIQRLDRTQNVFELTAQQEQFLTVRGVSPDVIRHLRRLNRNLIVADPSPTPNPGTSSPVSDPAPKSPDRSSAGLD